MDEANRLRSVYARRADPTSGKLSRYSVFDRANLYLIQRLERELLFTLRREGVTSFDSLRVLDVGCGAGPWLRRFAAYGADPSRLSGIDLRTDAIEEAKRRGPGMDIREGNAIALPWGDGTFDLVTQFTAFSSVLDAGTRDQMAAEMRRVLAPGGIILWYDMRINPTNRDVIGLRKKDILALFPGCSVRFRSVTLAPPIGRLVASRSWAVASTLELFPFLRTHLLAAIRPSA